MHRLPCYRVVFPQTDTAVTPAMSSKPPCSTAPTALSDPNPFVGPARAVCLQPVSPTGRHRPASIPHAMALSKSALLSCMRSDLSQASVVSGPHGPRTRRFADRFSCQAAISPHPVLYPPRSLSGQILRTSKSLHNPNPIAIFAVISSSSSPSRDLAGECRGIFDRCPAPTG